MKSPQQVHTLKIYECSRDIIHAWQHIWISWIRIQIQPAGNPLIPHAPRRRARIGLTMFRVFHSFPFRNCDLYTHVRRIWRMEKQVCRHVPLVGGVWWVSGDHRFIYRCNIRRHTTKMKQTEECGDMGGIQTWKNKILYVHAWNITNIQLVARSNHPLPINPFSFAIPLAIHFWLAWGRHRKLFGWVSVCVALYSTDILHSSQSYATVAFAYMLDSIQFVYPLCPSSVLLDWYDVIHALNWRIIRITMEN